MPPDPTLAATLAELDRLHEKATKAPWWYGFVDSKNRKLECEIGEFGERAYIAGGEPFVSVVSSDYDGATMSLDDMRLTLALRNMYPSLSAELRRLQEDNERLRAELAHVRGHNGNLAQKLKHPAENNLGRNRAKIRMLGEQRRNLMRKYLAALERIKALEGDVASGRGARGGAAPLGSATTEENAVTPEPTR